MNFSRLFSASLLLTRLNYVFNAETVGFKNESPDNTWVLRSTGDDPDEMLLRYHLVLSPGESELLEEEMLKSFVYQVCDTSGEASVLYVNGPLPMCAVFSGAEINITYSIGQLSVASISSEAIEAINISYQAPFYGISCQLALKIDPLMALKIDPPDTF